MNGIQFVWNSAIYQPSEMYGMTDLIPILHFKKLDYSSEVEMVQQYWHLGHPAFANKPRGVTRGKKTSELSLELPFATALDLKRNYKLAYGEKLVGGLTPIVAVVIFKPNNPSIPVLQDYSIEIEFVVKSDKGTGGESGSTDEIITTFECIVTAEAREFYGGIEV